MDDRREHGNGNGETGVFSISFKSKTLRVSSLIALLTAAAGLFAYQNHEDKVPAAVYSPELQAKVRDLELRQGWVEGRLGSIESSLKYLVEAEMRRQGREQVEQRR